MKNNTTIKVTIRWGGPISFMRVHYIENMFINNIHVINTSTLPLSIYNIDIMASPRELLSFINLQLLDPRRHTVHVGWRLGGGLRLHQQVKVLQRLTSLRGALSALVWAQPARGRLQNTFEVASTFIHITIHRVGVLTLSSVPHGQHVRAQPVFTRHPPHTIAHGDVRDVARGVPHRGGLRLM